MGLLYWIRVNWADRDYYTTSFSSFCLAIHLEILREISAKHVLQRPKVLELLTLAFEMDTGLDALAAVRGETTTRENSN